MTFLIACAVAYADATWASLAMWPPPRRPVKARGAAKAMRRRQELLAAVKARWAT